jgi:1-phosphatidylinositol-4-phosphate 5-kinase
VYEGEYRAGRPSGIGKYTWKGGVTYEGEFLEGYRHGKGVIKAEKYVKFEGIFVGERPSGKGELKYENGDSFSGEFKDGEKNGYGVIRFKSEHRTVVGMWKGNEYV